MHNACNAKGIQCTKNSIHNACNAQRMQCTTHAMHNTINAQLMQWSTHAMHNACNAQLMQCTTHAMHNACNKQWQQWKTTNNVHWTQYYEKMSYIDCLNFDFISVWGACFARYGFTKGQYYSKHHLHYCLRIVAKSQLIFDSWKILQSIAEFGQYRGSVAQYW